MVLCSVIPFSCCDLLYLDRSPSTSSYTPALVSILSWNTLELAQTHSSLRIYFSIRSLLNVPRWLPLGGIRAVKTTWSGYTVKL